MVHGVVSNSIHWIEALKRRSPSPGPGSFSKVHIADDFPTGTWSCCGKMDHRLTDCPFKDANC